MCKLLEGGIFFYCLCGVVIEFEKFNMNKMVIKDIIQLLVYKIIV